MYSKLFHKDVWFPEGTQELVKKFQQNFIGYFYSEHFKERLNNCNDRSHDYLPDAVIKCLATIKDNPQEAFEVEYSKGYYDFNDSRWHLTKYCIRIPYSPTQDLCVAIRPKFNKETGKYMLDKNMIVTAWLNSKSDKHFTLDNSKYSYTL